MTIDLKRWQSLKSEIESHNKQAERAAGALEQLKGQLQKEFSITKIDKAKPLLETMTKELAVAEKVYEQDLEVFKREHADKLEGSR